MRAPLSILALLLTSSALTAQSLQEMVDSLPLPEALPAEASSLALPQLPGAELRIAGSDCPALIDTQGVVRHAPSEVQVRVCFTLTRGEESVTSRDYSIAVAAAQATEEGANPAPQVAPALLSWRGGKGVFRVGKTLHLAGDALSRRLGQELEADFGKQVVFDAAGADIRFSDKPAQPTGEEGYLLEIRPDGVCIAAETERGRYWGTRTLLQLLRQGNELPIGTAYDAPRFRLRGFMLDCGRLPVTLDFIRDLIRTMSWYKLNDLHLHLNDNFIFHEKYVDSGRDPFRESYAAFRLQSLIPGLTARDLSYSKQQFRELIREARQAGVNIVPEFDVPGHALAFTRVRPDLIYQGKMSYKEKRRCEMLDASNPETMRFIGMVFDEYLLPQGKNKPVFEDCVVHVGADEFFGEAEDYRRFADALLSHVQSRGYTPRIWGSLSIKKGQTPVRSKGVQMNLWNGGWQDAVEALAQGYDIINTDDGWLYIVPFAPYYRADFNPQRLYDSWLPQRIGKHTLPAAHPQLLGATYAVWNDQIDLEYRGYGAEDTWPSIVGCMEPLAQKMWGGATTGLSFADYQTLVHRIGEAPGTQRQALRWLREPLELENPPLQLGKTGLAPSYRALLELTIPRAEKMIPLLRGPEGTVFASDAAGNVGFTRADSVRFSFNTKLPVGRRCTLEILARPGKTEIRIDGQPAGHLTLPLCHGNDKDLVSTLVLPLAQVGTGNARVQVHRLRVEPLPPLLHRDLPLDHPSAAAEPAAPAEVATPVPTE
ncbi:MAG: family 20 glycosylhydrolase [Akkermansia sp.]